MYKVVYSNLIVIEKLFFVIFHKEILDTESMVHCKINNHLTARTGYIIQFIHNTSSLRRLRNMSAWEKIIRQ